MNRGDDKQIFSNKSNQGYKWIIDMVEISMDTETENN